MDEDIKKDRDIHKNSDSAYSSEWLERLFRRNIFIRVAAAVFLIAVAAIVFFACREDDKSSPPPISRPSEKATELPEATRTNGRRTDTFESGTLISGVDVGGLEISEARERLANEERRLFSAYECVLMHGEHRFVLSEKDMKLASDLDEVLAAAMRRGKGEYELAVHPVDDRMFRDAVDAIAESVDRPARDAELLSATAAAGLDIEEIERNSRFVITAPVEGVKVDKAETSRHILCGVESFELPVNSIKPSDSIPSLPQRRAVFSTSYNSPALSAQGRVHNIKKAAELINTRSLKPGEMLSCNEVLGERTAENGWQTATAFASGGKKTEQQYGGGICQVSTTLYNCALMAGLEVPERIGHSRKVAYVEGGRDASLSWGGADLVIKNSTDDTIHIFMWTDDERSCLMCEIYGGAFPEEYDRIELISELVEVTEPSEPEFMIDDSLKEGDCVPIRAAIRGRVYQTYLEYRKNGVPLWREEAARTPYPMIPALYAVPPSRESTDNG